MSDRKFVRNALRLEARHKGVKESAYVRKSWNELQIEKIGAYAKGRAMCAKLKKIIPMHQFEVPIQAPYAYVVAEGLRIIITHGDAVMTDAEKDAMAAHLKADLFISGHIHTTVLEKRGKTVFLNPGSAALSKRADGKETCAVLEDGVIRIFDLADGTVLESLNL